MADVGTLNLLEEIHALVSDKLQVVSYKWLSRNFSVSSNDAKKLLQEFAEKHGSGLEILYILAGWLKRDPSIYHIRLVPGLKLSDAKQEFDENCSVQVYSVQVCIPKDPAALWNSEFVQAEELFNQSPTVNNCLRDNRFCGVSNSCVKRNAEGVPGGFQAPKLKISEGAGLLKSNCEQKASTAPQPQQSKVLQASPKVGLQSPTVVTTGVKIENNGTEVQAYAREPRIKKEEVAAFPANKRKGQNEKVSSGKGGSLANLWGRASAKSKPSCPPAENNVIVPNPTASADDQICAREAVDAVSSDDDGHDLNYKRTSNGEGSRKRRVVFDFSDEENDFENAVNLASPEPPKSKSSLDSKMSIFEKNNVNFEKQKEDMPRIKQENATERDSNLPIRKNSAIPDEGMTAKVSLPEKIQCHNPEGMTVVEKDKLTDAAPNSPKRRKVLKTRIDDRGREVNEVVWEGEETEAKKADKTTMPNPTNSRPPPASKSPALGSTAQLNPAGKAGNKKTGKGGGAKDAKQGNIMSFFKRVA